MYKNIKKNANNFVIKFILLIKKNILELIILFLQKKVNGANNK